MEKFRNFTVFYRLQLQQKTTMILITVFWVTVLVLNLIKRQ